VVVATRGETALVVGGDEYIVATIQNILRKEGYYVDATTSGQQAIEQAESSRHNIIIIDVKLPDIPGVEVAHRMRLLDTEARLIVLADDSTFGDCIDLLDWGVEEILMKPVETNELKRIIVEAFYS